MSQRRKPWVAGAKKKTDHRTVSEPHINTLGQEAKGLHRGMVPTHAASAIWFIRGGVGRGVDEIVVLVAP